MKRKPRKGITALTVQGYKSFSKEQRLEIQPLTILAGANSSGKSSVIQPLLLLKQTLEASYDPGLLLLDGPNVKFTSTNQLLTKIGQKRAKEFRVGIELDGTSFMKLIFKRENGKGLKGLEVEYSDEESKFRLSENLSHEELTNILPKKMGRFLKVVSRNERELKWTVKRDRFFLSASVKNQKDGLRLTPLPLLDQRFSSEIRRVIHLPGLRGNPERTYPTTNVGDSFPGLFQTYVASIISRWESEKNKKLNEVGNMMEALGLTWKVAPKAINETQVELRVGRLPSSQRGGARDLVSIADVGIGISQTLPVVVSLLVAKRGQILLIEQPEIHLHPKAQYKLAELLVKTAKRGVKVIVETHSALLLRSIQTLVAEKKINSDDVILHWFTRREDGSTEIKSSELDAKGCFGDWPEDFGSVELKAERRFLEASLD